MENTLKRRSPILAVMALALALSACSNMDETQQRTLSGGAIGAVGGTAITAMTGGCIWCGALIGGAVGSAGGYLYDQTKKGNM